MQEKKEKNKRKFIVGGAVSLVLVAIVGVTYAIWNYMNMSKNQILVAGDIYMKFSEGNEVSIPGAMPLDINNYYTEKSEFNPNPSEEDVTSCVGLFTSMLEGFDDIQGFCKGTTQYSGENIEQYLASHGLTEQFKTVLPNYFISNNYFDNGPKVSTYTVNTNMNSGELTACENYFNELDGGNGDWFEKTETAEAFCQGTGTSFGLSFQSLIDGKYLTTSQLSELKEQNIVIENVREYPSLDYFQFTIEGKNDYKKDINYEILLQEGKEPEDRHTRLKSELLKFRLAEVEGEEEKEIFTNRSYKDLNNAKIYIDTIPAKTENEIKKTYRLYMWISNDTKIGNTEGVDYDDTTWATDVFASVKVNVNGDFDNKEITYDKEVATTVVKNTLGTPNGVIGLDNNSNPVTVAGDNIREYRYSGPVVNNYVYYNCENENNQTKDTCEIWRIVGVFKDNQGEHLKIVRDSVLEANKLPTTYTVEGREYNIAFQPGIPSAYWNKPTDENYNNDWTTAGLQYYLNSESDDNGVNKGYLSYLEEYSKNMIEETTYYLGNVTFDNVQNGTSYIGAIIDTPREAYINERGSAVCSDTYDCGGGHIWPGNSATWPGKVGLLYPSDFGFSASSTYWDTSLAYGSFNIKASNTSWMEKAASGVPSWLLSPSSDRTDGVAGWGAGYVGYGGVCNDLGVRPSFNLISQAQIGPGSGAKMDPYWLYGA